MENNGFFTITQLRNPFLCFVLLQRTQKAARAVKKQGETLLPLGSCFPLHFFRTLGTSCGLYNRRKRGRSYLIGSSNHLDTLQLYCSCLRQLSGSEFMLETLPNKTTYCYGATALRHLTRGAFLERNGMFSGLKSQLQKS